MAKNQRSEQTLRRAWANAQTINAPWFDLCLNIPSASLSRGLVKVWRLNQLWDQAWAKFHEKAPGTQPRWLLPWCWRCTFRHKHPGQDTLCEPHPPSPEANKGSGTKRLLELPAFCPESCLCDKGNRFSSQKMDKKEWAIMAIALWNYGPFESDPL